MNHNKPIEPSPLESLIERMPLQAPSDSLDQKMKDIFSNSLAPCESVKLPMELPTGENLSSFEDSSTPSSWRLWPAFVSTALVASFAGLLAGQVFDLGFLDRASLPNQMSVAIGNSSPNLTPVKFNFDAFNLLHGHSQTEITCEQCHVGSDNETLEMFSDWYYGDKAFFDKHVHGDWSNCSDCHIHSKPRPKKGEIEIPKDARPTGRFNPHANSEKINCSDCHLAGNAAKQENLKDG